MESCIPMLITSRFRIGGPSRLTSAFCKRVRVPRLPISHRMNGRDWRQLNNMEPALEATISRFQRLALIVGVVCLALGIVGAFLQPRQFFFSYLFAFLFWLGLSLGCFLVTMIHQLTGGRWGYPTRRFMEAGFMALPLMLVLFIPIFVGLHQLYPWARLEE